MTKNLKKQVLEKIIYCKNDDFSLQKPENRKIGRFTFLAISPTIFELQRRTIPHFNPLNKLI